MGFPKKNINPRNFSLFIKSLFFYFSAACVTIIFLTLTLNYLFKQKSREDINNLTNITLSDIHNRINTLFETSKNQAFQLYYNNNSKIIRTSEQKEVLREVAYANDIQYLMTTSPYIKSVYLFNENTCLFKKYNNEYDFDIDNNSLMKIVKQTESFSIYPRKVTRENGDSIYLFTIIYLESASKTNSSFNGAIMLNLDYDSCYDYIFKGINQDENEIIYMNSDSEILFHPDKEYFMTYVSDDSYIHSIFEKNEKSGYFTINESGKDISINYYTDNKDNYVIYKRSLDSITKEFTKTRNTILYVSVISLIALIILSFLVSYKLYLPLSKLLIKIKNSIRIIPDTQETSLSELQLLSNAFSNLIKKVNDLEKNKNYTLRNECIKKFLNSSISMTSEDAEKLISENDIDLNIYSPSMILVLRLDNFHELQSSGEDSLRLVSLSVGNIATEILSGINGVEYCQHFEIEDSHEVLIINLTENNKENINDIIVNGKTIQTSVYNVLNISITIGISEVTNEYKNWKNLYSKALDFTNYRLIYGKKHIFDKSSITTANKQIDLSRMLDKMIESVTSANESKFKYYLTQLFAQIKDCSYKKIIDTLTFVSQSLLEITKTEANSLNENYLNVYNQLLEIEDINELNTWFLNIYETTCSVIHGMYTKKTEDIVNQVIDFINENYNDSQLSANLISDKINITPQYFSRVFKEITDKNFPEFVNSIRLKKAKELIISTDMTVKEISNQVGYNNTTYFVTLFRKKYGIPPSKYRLNMKYNN